MSNFTPGMTGGSFGARPPIRIIKASLFAGVVMFFIVSMFVRTGDTRGAATFNWNGAPPIVHQLAPIVLLLGFLSVWWFSRALRRQSDPQTRSTTMLIMCAFTEAFALLGVVTFLMTRDPIVIAWAAPAFIVSLLVEPTPMR